MVRPVPWVPPVLYGAVLAGGVYYAAIGPGLGARTAGYTALLCVLIVLDARERRVPPGLLLAVRVVLFGAVTGLDVSGLSRVLFVLVPFLGYFAFGPMAAVALGAACVAVLVGAFTLTVPNWQVRAEYISDLLMFALGVVLSVTMAAVAVREQRARSRLEATLEQIAELSAARERNRLAREIHDSLGHHLTAIGIQLEKAEAFAALDPAGAAQAVSSARWSAGRALEEVRASVRALDAQGISAALADLVRALDDGERRITLSVSGAERRPLHVLYRAAQEGLTNACRHADATEIRVAVRYHERGAELRVTDDGRGFGDGREGFGLKGLRERVRQAAGTMTVESSSTGTELRVNVPW
ncbi:Signal transduction histidine kinase [Thermomonospora echinospora]|uniref:Signal transduction histidine kinase n=1 Tax=Thermomonospora echinospora TaxID=1992 RepID=A0A1H6D019_9ACTN|nr:sensor histidine kinase [Thermomonospora echinospora]SEG78632.1 Signal transduction histidine kinase [Thermomonospora echinospora]